MGIMSFCPAFIEDGSGRPLAFRISSGETLYKEAMMFKSSPSFTRWWITCPGVGVRICSAGPGVKVGLGVLVGVAAGWLPEVAML